MAHFTFLSATVTILIAAVLLFWLFGPSKPVQASLNFVGGGIQWVYAKIMGLFGKK